MTLVISQNEKYAGICSQISVDADECCRLRKCCSSLQRKAGNMKMVAASI